MSEREEYYAGFDPGRETEIEEAEADAFDVEVEREQIRELNEQNQHQRVRLNWIIGLGLTVLLLWGYVFWRIHRMIVQ